MELFNKDKDTDNIFEYLVEIVVIFILAFPICIIDIKFKSYRESNKDKRYALLLIFLQILIGCLYLFFLFKLIPHVTNSFQLTLTGMYFAGIFYSLQYEAFVDLHTMVKELITV